MWRQFLTAASAALVTFLVAVITIPTEYVVGRLRFAVNRADQRDDRYKALSDEVSKYVFASQIFSEFFVRDLDRTTVETTVKEYNEAIVALRTHEYANRAVIRKYWKPETVKAFDEFMRKARSIDRIAHEVNMPLVKFEADKEKPLILNDANVKAVATRMAPAVSELCASADSLLSSLDGIKVDPPKRGCD